MVERSEQQGDVLLVGSKRKHLRPLPHEACLSVDQHRCHLGNHADCRLLTKFARRLHLYQCACTAKTHAAGIYRLQGIEVANVYKRVVIADDTEGTALWSILADLLVCECPYMSQPIGTNALDGLCLAAAQQRFAR